MAGPPEELTPHDHKFVQGEAMPPPGPSRRKMAVHHSSASVEHYTPSHIVALAQRVLGHIDLDPCAETIIQGGEYTVPATHHLTKEDDGLTYPWKGRVYMNPPYGRVIGDWIEKFVDEYDAENMTAGIALLPARTDTRWFRDLNEATLCFLSGRLTFGGSTNPAPFPSMLAHLGRGNMGFIIEARKVGLVYVPL